MSNNWQKAYDKLKEYIVGNPGIEIETNCVCIPSEVRPGFYRLFNAACVSFGKDNLPALLERAYELSRKWGEVSRSVMDDLKLETIDADDSIRWLLSDPDDGLARVLFDPLFDLLKGRKDLAAFEQTAVRLLEEKFAMFSREGYQCWAAVSLLKLLAADKVYDIPRSDFDRDPSLFEEELYGTRKESAPEAEEANKISFEHNHMFSFMVPKVIVRSTRLGFYAALCSDFDFNDARWQARNLSQEQEWYGISDIRKEFGRYNLWSDLALYTGTHWKDLVITADYFQMVRPEIIMEFRVEKDWYEKEGLESVKRHYNVLKPRLGSYVICREPVPEAALKELEARPELQPEAKGVIPETTARLEHDIHLLSAGYDVTKLEPVIESILKARTRPKGTTV